jgi:hypothetical protein
MKRLLPISLTLLILSSAPAYAEWVEVAKGDNVTSYMDPDTIRSKGTMVKMWGLDDQKTTRTSREGKSFLSLKMQQEYDCAEEQWRSLAEYGYSGQMGTGEIVFSHTKPNDWAPAIPGSVGQANWKFACKKLGTNGPIF